MSADLRLRGSDASPGKPASVPTTRHAWAIVAKREMLVHITDKNFIAGTLFTVVTLVAVFGAQMFFAGRSHHFDVAVVTPQAAAVVQQASADPQAREDKTTLSVVNVPDVAAARDAVREGNADAMLLRGEGQWVITGDNAPEDSLQEAITTVVSRDALSDVASKAGVSGEAIEKETTVPFLLLDSDMKEAGFFFFSALVFAMLFYLSSILFGMNIANSVVQEKQSRIVEIIAAAIPVNQLLLGKVVGMIALAMGQMLLYVGIGLLGVSFTDYKNLLPALADGSMWFIVFFVVGFAALASVWAMAGALASRSEDLSQTTMPITTGLMLTLFAGIYASGSLLRVLSFVPVVSSVAMPRRILEGGIVWWEPVVALLITVAFALAIVRFASVIYRRALMQTGGKLSIRQALAAQD